jgi:hypothetical protein
MKQLAAAFLCLALLACAPIEGSAPAADAADAPNPQESRHEGYYYPRLTSREVYKARAQTLKDSDKQRRLGFIALMLGQQLELPYPPQRIMFAKGDEAEKLIIVGFGDAFETIYRARAVLAAYTALARQTDLFQDFQVEDVFTFFDLATLLGFKEITLSDGRAWAHRVTLE